MGGNFESVLLKVLKKYFILIIIVGLVCSFALGKIMKGNQKTEYVAKFSVVVLDNAQSKAEENGTDTSICEVLIGSTMNLDTVVKEAGIKNLDVNTIKNHLIIEKKGSVVNVQYTGPDEKETYEVANLIAKNLVNIYESVNPKQAITVIDQPTMPLINRTSSLKMYYAGGFVGGLLLAIIVLYFVTEFKKK